MNPIIVIEFALLAAVLWILVSQITLPLVRGTKLFPMFTREPKLKAALAAAKQAREEAALESRIAAEGAIKEASQPQHGEPK